MAFLFIAFCFALAALVKGLFGMGLPTVAMGLLGLVMAPVQAAILLVIPTLITNLWQLATGPSIRTLLSRFATMILADCIGTVIGIGFLTSTSPFVPFGVGGILIVYGSTGLLALHFHVSPQQEKWFSPLIGLLTGVVNGATALSTVPLVPYLSSLQLPREELIQSMGLLFTVSSLALTSCLVATGHLQFTSTGASALALIPVFLGMFLGTTLRRKMHAEVFRKWFFAGMLALGACMVVQVVNRLR